jgi:hypothetical protein
LAVTVSDDLKKIKHDTKLISLGEPYEVRYWCKRLRCTKRALGYAVESAGNSSNLVRKFIREMRKT